MDRPFIDMLTKHKHLKHAPWEIVETLIEHPDWVENPEYDVRQWKIGIQIPSVWWFRLLAKQPQFAPCYNFGKDKSNYEPWSELLAAQPQFEEDCWWEKVERLELVAMYYRCPEIVRLKFPNGDVRELAKFLTTKDIYLLLSMLPEAEELFDWKEIAPAIKEDDWLYLLSKQPQFECHFDWNRVKNKKTFFWEKLLIRQPQFAKYCDLAMLYDFQIRKLQKHGLLEEI